MRDKPNNRTECLDSCHEHMSPSRTSSRTSGSAEDFDENGIRFPSLELRSKNTRAYAVYGRKFPTLAIQEPRLDALKSDASRSRWKAIWLKWGIWIVVYGLFSRPQAILFPEFGPPGALGAVIAFIVLGIVVGGLITVVSWWLLRNKSSLAWGERTSMSKGVLISIVIGVIFGIAECQATPH